MADHYLNWYRNDRCKFPLNGLSPIEYRKNLNLAV
ncbi:IS3 family transposase [Hallerella sp.]